MLGDHIYVYKACQIVVSEAAQQWTYIVIFEDEHYEPCPRRNFNNEEDALKAATVSPIDGFHRRKNMGVPG